MIMRWIRRILRALLMAVLLLLCAVLFYLLVIMGDSADKEASARARLQSMPCAAFDQGVRRLSQADELFGSVV